MKVRCGFVTNSSSTSYLIAVKSDITDMEIEKIASQVTEIVVRERDYNEFIDEYGLSVGDIYDEAVGILREINSNGMQLDSWKVKSFMVEWTGELEEMCVFGLNQIKHPKIKMCSE